jgi:tRNA(adenine34) deaminase
MPFPLPLPMRLALDLAAEAARAGEVPVAAVVARGEVIIATSANMMLSGNDPTAHAEIVAIRRAAEALGQPRLDGLDLWVTLEPCAMCAGAIAHHRPEVYAGIGAEEAAGQLRGFFAERR